MDNPYRLNDIDGVVAYNPRVPTFGEHVLKLRGERTTADVARAALGEQASTNQIRNFANYISRIERGETAVQNSKATTQQKLAKGLGVKLSELIAALEGVPTLNDPHPQIASSQHKESAVESDASPTKADPDGVAVQQTVGDAALFKAFVAAATEAITASTAGLAGAIDRLAASIEQAAKTRADSSTSGKRSARGH